MMEHTTDRLFWTLTSIIVGALILTIGINAFPKATQGVIQPISGITKQADTTTKTADGAANDTIKDLNMTQAQKDALAKAPSVNMNLNMSSTPQDQNGFSYYINNLDTSNHTLTISRITPPASFNASSYDIPSYMKINGDVYTVTQVNGSSNFIFNSQPSTNLTTINIPSTVTFVDSSSFLYGGLINSDFPKNKTITINMPKTVTYDSNAYDNPTLTKYQNGYYSPTGQQDLSQQGTITFNINKY